MLTLDSRYSNQYCRISLFTFFALLAFYIVVYFGNNIQDPEDGFGRVRAQELPSTSLKKSAGLLENSAHPITLVTAYFFLNKAKYSAEQYNTWIKNFLPKIRTPIVIFTDTRGTPWLLQLRKSNLTRIVTLKNVWQLPPISKYKDIYQEQHKIDPEKTIHSPELYAVWNSKSWMLSRSTELNPFNSTYFFWVDIGSFRDETEKRRGFTQWPDPKKVNKLFVNGMVNKIQLFTIRKFGYDYNNYDYKKASQEVVVIGTFFGGMKGAIQIWSKTYYEMHDILVREGLFVGKDQLLMNYVVMKLHQHVLITCSCGSDLRSCGRKSHYLYFQNWYAMYKEKLPNCTDLPVFTMDKFLDIKSLKRNRNTKI